VSIDGDGADVIWAMNDRVQYGEAHAAKLGLAGHTGYGHYRERYVRCPDRRWRIAATTLSYLQFDARPLPG
jgi:hypothetical protein